MACIHRLNAREGKALDAASMQGTGHGPMLPRPHLRAKLRRWFRVRWDYLVQEHERLVP